MGGGYPQHLSIFQKDAGNLFNTQNRIQWPRSNEHPVGSPSFPHGCSDRSLNTLVRSVIRTSHIPLGKRLANYAITYPRKVRARGLSYPKTKDLTPTAWHTAYPKIKDLTPILKTHWHTDVQITLFGEFVSNMLILP